MSILFLIHVCRLPAVVVRPANAFAKYMLRRQHIADENQVKPHNLGPMHCKCQCCQALHFMHEHRVGKAKFGEATFSQCCKRGKEVLPALKPTPPVLKSLICKQRPRFFAFLKIIRSYSCAFQMASSGEIFLHTCSSYQHICMQVCIGEQESSYSVMDSWGFFVLRIMHMCTLQLMLFICAGIKDTNRERFPTGDTTFGVQGNVHHYIGYA